MKFQQVPIQRVKDFWDSYPCNINHSLHPVGTKEYFDEVEARKYFVEPHILGFAEFERWQDKRVLEIGCGIGTDTVNFARHGAKVTAMDISKESLAIARQRAEAYRLNNISFYCGNAEELKTLVPNEPYDLIYVFGVIHHTPHPKRLIEQMRYYVRPGSIVKIMVYYRYSWKVFWILVKYGQGHFWHWADLIARYSEAETDCPVTFTFTKRQIRKILELNGLKIKEMHIEHIFPYRIPEYISHRYVKAWYFRMLPQPLFRWLERHFGWHLCITAQAQ